MNSLLREPCPDCGALFAAHSGPTHRYIGASAGCWALYTEMLVSATPSRETLRQSTVTPRPRPKTTPPTGAELLLVDAYAAQHHGVPSPQAIQSVAIHLLALHGTIGLGLGPDRALWIRERGLRQRGVFAWLAPPPPTAALTIRHVFPEPALDTVCSVGHYVVSVYEAWMAAHHQQIDAWYRAYVISDDVSARGRTR